MPANTNNKGPKFEVNDRVFVDHGTLYYEAKVLEVHLETRGPQYLVHYQGWNSRYDETVGERMVLPYSDANAKTAKDLQDKMHPRRKRLKASLPPGAANKSVDGSRDRESSRASTPSIDGSTSRQKTSTGSNDSAIDIPPNRGQNRKRPNRSSMGDTSSALANELSSVETPEEYKNRLEIKVTIPEDLKPVLVDDWDLVTRQFKLVQLPASISVRQVLEDYLKTKSGLAVSAGKLSQITEVVKGVREYFDVMLGTQLLYKYERLQYSDVRKEQPGVPPSSQYGPVHLLRLFVRLGHMLAYTPLNEKHIGAILGHVHDLLGYLRRNKATLFPLDDYVTAPPQYQRAAFS